MIDIKKIYKEAFIAIKKDTKLLELIGVDTSVDVNNNDFLTQLRKHVIEATAPDDILNDYGTRLCLHDRGGTYTSARKEEIGFFAIDIHMSKDKNLINGNLSEVEKRLIEVIDTKHRAKQGLQPLDVGLYGLQYFSRTMDEKSTTTGWEKVTVVFEYRYFI